MPGTALPTARPPGPIATTISACRSCCTWCSTTPAVSPRTPPSGTLRCTPASTRDSLKLSFRDLESLRGKVFPRAIPLLESLLPLNRLVHVLVHLGIHERGCASTRAARLLVTPM